MEGDFIKTNEWLKPLSWIYGLAVGIRNSLFDIGIKKERSFKTPVIAVGNITVGGTGKTPHVEYLVELLKQQFKVAVLSRGYKRKTRGFLIAESGTESWSANALGDEPYQMARKYPDAVVAVDANRCHGIELLTNDTTVKDIDVVVLDDAFQHRYVKPGINILLVDYHRLIIYDSLLPAGRLREPLSGKNRADVVIVTKCPKELKPMEFRVITKAMSLYPYQHLFFSTLGYGDLKAVFGKEKKALSSLPSDMNILLLTGIASPEQMIVDLGNIINKDATQATSSNKKTTASTTSKASNIVPLTFSDHHNFTPKDINRINDAFSSLPSPRIIITTEKDATRLEATEGLSPEVKKAMFVLPVYVEFMQNQQETFNEKIIGYVRKNSRNSILVKGKNDHKPNHSNHSGDRPRTISFRDN